MTGFDSKRKAALDEDGMYLVHQTAQPVQEPTLQEQLAIAQAARDKAVAAWDKADAAWSEAFAEIMRIQKLMEKNNG